MFWKLNELIIIVKAVMTCTKIIYGVTSFAEIEPSLPLEMSNVYDQLLK